MSTLALIGLGSNLGDRRAHLDTAIAALRQTPGITVRAVSSCQETAPVGGPGGQGAFLNAAVALDTSLEPHGLWATLQAIERQAGRVRAVRWGERTLDLDLLLFGDHILDTPELTVPHLRMAVRRFVLAPLAEIAPDAVDPLTRRTVAELLAHLDRRPSYIALRHRAPEVFRRLVSELSAAGLSAGHGRFGEELGTDPAGWTDLTRRTALEQMARELRGDRWSFELWGDRWIVTDFWFDDLYRTVPWDSRRGSPPGLDATRVLPFTAPDHAARSRLIRPTFVVAMHDDALEPLPAWAARNHPNFPVGCDCPQLRLREIQHHRTACSDALEAGDREHADRLRTAWIEACVAEILAACAASRAGVEV